jgi:hypothetical protein
LGRTPLRDPGCIQARQTPESWTTPLKLKNLDFLELFEHFYKTLDPELEDFIRRIIFMPELFFPKTLDTDSVYGSIQNLITPVILRTTDTNTRIRKRSVDLINIIWDHK